MNSPKVELDLLSDFFGGCFHQDWQHEYETTNPDQVLAVYSQEHTGETLARLRQAILRYVEANRDEAELEKKLLTEFDCYFQPSTAGKSARDWLLSIAKLLGGQASTPGQPRDSG